MAVSIITSATTTLTPTTQVKAHTGHGHHARRTGGDASDSSSVGGASTSSTTACDANESIEERARSGDAQAIAELKAERVDPTTGQPIVSATTTPSPTGPSEPGKGEEVDEYI